MDKNVFINCPFDVEYSSLLHPLLFTIIKLGYNPRIALECSDSSKPRLEKLLDIIKESIYSIHDLSRLQAKKPKEFYRLNMPFELGLDYSAKHFDDNLSFKKFLILETEKFNYMKALSDINGLDIKSHKDEPIELMKCIVSWFTETVGVRSPYSSLELWYEFTDFNANLYNDKLAYYEINHNSTKAEMFAKDKIEHMTLVEYMDEIKKTILSSSP